MQANKLLKVLSVIWALGGILGLTGCDYSVALQKTPQVVLDRTLVGLWQKKSDDQKVQHLTILTLSDKEYLVVYRSGTPEAFYGRATICQDTDFTLLQIQWLGTANNRDLFSQKPYQYAAYAVHDKTLHFSMLNPAIVKPATTPAELLAAIKAHGDHPELFHQEQTYQWQAPPKADKKTTERPPVPAGW